jgi:hypothetical protein
MTTIQKFLKNIMKNDFFKDENDNFIKYTNKNFDVIQQKTKDGKKESCIVINKKFEKPIFYNDIQIAYNNIYEN